MFEPTVVPESVDRLVEVLLDRDGPVSVSPPIELRITDAVSELDITTDADADGPAPSDPELFHELFGALQPRRGSNE